MGTPFSSPFGKGGLGGISSWLGQYSIYDVQLVSLSPIGGGGQGEGEINLFFRFA